MEKYVYNHQTLQYEKVKINTKQKAVRFSSYLLSVSFTAAILFGLAYHFFPSPKEQAFEREIDQMEFYYSSLTSDFENLSKELNKLQEKDAEVHRMILGVDPLDEAIWNGGIGGHDRHTGITEYKRSGELLTETLDKVEKLKRKMQMQGMSFDTLYSMAVLKEDKLASIPSIKPVEEDKLKRKIKNLSGFGIRMHPVHKVKKFHKGIDFTAPEGTPIQATGNGTIERIEKKRRGYGYNILINHGWGYQSLYAHMKTIEVKKGQKVKKGERIGTVGNTGTSTAAHLHYEVRLNNKAVNPIDYCLDGLAPEEYKELLEKASVENQSFD